jgi:hypothetical protein
LAQAETLDITEVGQVVVVVVALFLVVHIQ